MVRLTDYRVHATLRSRFLIQTIDELLRRGTLGKHGTYRSGSLRFLERWHWSCWLVLSIRIYQWRYNGLNRRLMLIEGENGFNLGFHSLWYSSHWSADSVILDLFWQQLSLYLAWLQISKRYMSFNRLQVQLPFFGWSIFIEISLRRNLLHHGRGLRIVQTSKRLVLIWRFSLF